MNEEIRNYEENEITEVEVYEEPETSGGSFGFLLGGLALAVGATAVVLHKTKSKREAKRIEKLRKKGYIIVTPEEADALEADVDYEDVEE